MANPGPVKLKVLNATGKIAGHVLTVQADGTVDSAAGGESKTAPIAKIPGVDFTADATTNLYTVPAGEVFIVTHVEYSVQTSIGVTIVPVGGIGIAAGEDDIIASGPLNGLITNKVRADYSLAARKKALAGEIIKLGIDTFADGTLLVDVYLFGYFESALSIAPTGAGGDTTAIHDDTANEISNVALKASPVGADLALIEDSEAGNVKKRILLGSLPSGLPPYYINGLEVFVDATISADTLYVEPGSCRDRDNTADISTASRVTINSLLAHSASTGLPQAQGMDEVGLDNLVSNPITVSTPGYSAIATATGSIISSTEGDGKFTPYLPTNIVAMSTVGTAFTGGKDITRDVSYDDFVGNDSRGWSRVASVDSETTLTLAAALPGGDATAEAWSIIHNVTLACGTTGAVRPKSLSASGTVITLPWPDNHSAGSPLTLGGLPRDETPAWVAVWATNSGFYVSLQHIALLGVSVPARHIGWLPYNFDDRFYQMYYDNGGVDRRAHWAVGSSVSTNLYTASATLTRLSWNMTQSAIPRTAMRVSVALELVNVHVSQDGYVFFRRSGFGVASGAYGQSLRVKIGPSTKVTSITDLPVDGSGLFDSAAQLGIVSGVAFMRGWIENLGRPVPTPA